MLIFTLAGPVGVAVAATVIEVKLDIVLAVSVATEAGNAGCTTDVPDVRDTLVVEETNELPDVVADVAAVAMAADDAPA